MYSSKMKEENKQVKIQSRRVAKGSPNQCQLEQDDQASRKEAYKKTNFGTDRLADVWATLRRVVVHSELADELVANIEESKQVKK